MARDPRTPDCAVEDCKRAAYRGRVCRQHWYAVPASLRVNRMVRAITAAREAARESDAAIVTAASAIERTTRGMS